MQPPPLIRWRPWGAEAFREAKDSGKPILLSISAVWCHWCHVMDRTTYSDERIAQLINEHFIPIRVDTDRRPDINRRYNMGGWPTTAFLAHDGSIITGGTYIPAEQMEQVLLEVKSYYSKNRDSLAKLEEAKKRLSVQKAREGLSERIINDILLTVTTLYDPVNGGFGDQPKFPQADALRFALAQYLHEGQRGLLLLVLKTLERMASSALYDREMGGFFRYSVTRDWSTPHYEKMCEDNAKLLLCYLDAYSITKEERLLVVAKGIVDYVNSTLSDRAKGGFYGSQDADEEYYALRKEERLQREAPRVDRALYTSWNGLMISSYLRAALVMKDDGLKGFALKSLDRLLLEAKVKEGVGEGLFYHYLEDGKAHLPGLLLDQAPMGQALLDAYQLSGNELYLREAEALAERMLATLWDDEYGAFLDRPRGLASEGALSLPDRPLEENCSAAEFLLRLAVMADRERYRERAKDVLEAFSTSYGAYGLMASCYALAVDHYLNPLQVLIVGERGSESAQELLRAALLPFDSRKDVLLLDPSVEEDAKRIEALGLSTKDTPKAYLCKERICLEPTSDPFRLEELLLKGGLAGSG